MKSFFKQIKQYSVASLCATVFALGAADGHAWDDYGEAFYKTYRSNWTWDESYQNYKQNMDASYSGPTVWLTDQDIRLSEWFGRDIHNTYQWTEHNLELDTIILAYGMMFELDLIWRDNNPTGKRWQVAHSLEDKHDTTCTMTSGHEDDQLPACIEKINEVFNTTTRPAPIIVNFDMKSKMDRVDNTRFDEFVTAIQAIDASNRLQPKDLAGGEKRLRWKNAQSPIWPTFKELKGKFFCFVSGKSEEVQTYTENCLADWNNCPCLPMPNPQGNDFYNLYDDNYEADELETTIAFNPSRDDNTDVTPLIRDFGWMLREWTFKNDNYQDNKNRCNNDAFGRVNLCGVDFNYPSHYWDYKAQVDHATEYWSAQFSEETLGRGVCKPPMVVTAVRCSGSKCDNKQLLCTDITGGTLGTTLTSFHTTDQYSEEGTGLPSNSYNDRFLRGIRCNGGYCDNLKLDQVKVASSSLPSGDAYFTHTIGGGNDQRAHCKPGYAVGQIRCIGANCGSLSLICRRYTRPTNVPANNVTLTDQMLENQYIVQGGALRDDSNGYTFTVQADGNIVLYDDNRTAKWAASTQLSGAFKIEVKRGSNNKRSLKAYDVNGKVVWDPIGNDNTDVHKLELSGGKIRIKNANGGTLWSKP